VSGLGLVEKVVLLHQSLDRSGLTHAFGGALALAFCTAEPRGTRAIDVNVFLPPEDLGELEAALPDGVEVTDQNRQHIARDAQSRLWWQDTPVDVFLSNHPFHDQAEANRRFVRFAGVPQLPVLSCSDLAVFKTFFARPKDAIDIAAMVGAGAIDLMQLERDVSHLLGDGQERTEFFSLVRSAIPDYQEEE